jgi:hypothetical protein
VGQKNCKSKNLEKGELIMPGILKGRKNCSTCGKVFVKNRDNFYTQIKKGKVYFRSDCKQCQSKKMLSYRNLNISEPIENLELYLEHFEISLLHIVKEINRERGLI